MTDHYPYGSNAGMGMVPCRKNCTCHDCVIERLHAKVKELEEFTKYDYMSMKNWQEEKAALQAKVDELTDALELIAACPGAARDIARAALKTGD